MMSVNDSESYPKMYIKLTVAISGWVMRPAHKSVNANPLSSIWNGVFINVFFQIAAKINTLPTTAIGDKIAIMVAHERISL